MQAPWHVPTTSDLTIQGRHLQILILVELVEGFYLLIHDESMTTLSKRAWKGVEGKVAGSRLLPSAQAEGRRRIPRAYI